MREQATSASGRIGYDVWDNQKQTTGEVQEGSDMTFDEWLGTQQYADGSITLQLPVSGRLRTLKMSRPGATRRSQKQEHA